MAKVPITGLVAIHLAIAVVHGNAHSALAVALPPEKNAFVLLVILIAPIVAAVLMWTRYAAAGVWVFLISMLGAFLFGAYHHFIMVSPDHIAHLPAGDAAARSTFVVTAAALAVVELVAALYGAFVLRRTSDVIRTF